MTVIDRIASNETELTRLRRDIHAHPELGFEETRTADIVAKKLEAFGLEVHRGIGKTGVVGVLRAGSSKRSVGLRADMDALPIVEANTFAHRSTQPGRMHACGHDGHTTMLLGAAQYLAETRAFEGVVNFIFQPAEEGRAGAFGYVDEEHTVPAELAWDQPRLPAGAPHHAAVQASQLVHGLIAFVGVRSAPPRGHGVVMSRCRGSYRPGDVEGKRNGAEAGGVMAVAVCRG